jgi:hypothetical protein
MRSLAERGDKTAEALVQIMNGTQYVEMTAGAESSNVIRITGQVKDQDGQNVAAVKDILLKSKPVSGAGAMAVVGGQGTSKAGAASTELWLQTTATGGFQVDVTNTVAEDNLIVATVDNGETEVLKLTFA